jgi:cytochrome P450
MIIHTRRFYYFRPIHNSALSVLFKGTAILANPRTAFTKEIFGKDPWAFRPERFLDINTGELNALKNTLAPFGMGSRICPGEQLSNVSSFFFAVSLLRKYKLSVVPGEARPTTELVVGISAKPFPFRAMFTKR